MSFPGKRRAIAKPGIVYVNEQCLEAEGASLGLWGRFGSQPQSWDCFSKYLRITWDMFSHEHPMLSKSDLQLLWALRGVKITVGALKNIYPSEAPASKVLTQFEHNISPDSNAPPRSGMNGEELLFNKLPGTSDSPSPSRIPILILSGAQVEQYLPKQLPSKCVPWTTSIRMTWALAKNANSWAPSLDLQNLILQGWAQQLEEKLLDWGYGLDGRGRGQGEKVMYKLISLKQ